MKNIEKFSLARMLAKRNGPVGQVSFDIQGISMTNMLDRGGSAKLSSSSVDIA